MAGPRRPSRRRPQESDSGERKSSIPSPSYRLPTHPAQFPAPGVSNPGACCSCPHASSLWFKRCSAVTAVPRTASAGFQRETSGDRGGRGWGASVGGHVVRQSLAWATPSAAAMLYGRSESMPQFRLPGAGYRSPQVWRGKRSDNSAALGMVYEPLVSYAGLGTETQSRVGSLSQSFSLFGLWLLGMVHDARKPGAERDCRKTTRWRVAGEIWRGLWWELKYLRHLSSVLTFKTLIQNLSRDSKLLLANGAEFSNI